VHPPPAAAQPGVPLAPVLVPSSTFEFEESEAFADATAARIGSGYVYSRWANPTVDAFESAVADLEGADDAEAFASGMAAISSIFLGTCKSGDRIVAARQLYGGTHSLLSEVLPRFGVEAGLYDVDDYDGIAKGLAEGARLFYCETIGNPRVKVADLTTLGELADEADVPMIVDNTFASPILCRPIEHGASLVVHSATKFLGGHHDLVGGIACGSPQLLEPVRHVARELGPVLSPFDAWLALRGMATLSLRLERSSDNALAVARALAAHPRVEAVHYPALGDDPDKPLADALFGGRGGGNLGFDLTGGRDAARRFQDELRLVKRAASLGGTHTLIVHAASITHTQLNAEELEAAGISEGFCRLSVGIEEPADLIDDLTQALDATG
jgi:cystathionine beta-lyase/cystathionine gamma-synthase